MCLETKDSSYNVFIKWKKVGGKGRHGNDGEKKISWIGYLGARPGQYIHVHEFFSFCFEQLLLWYMHSCNEFLTVNREGIKTSVPETGSIHANYDMFVTL